MTTESKTPVMCRQFLCSHPSCLQEQADQDERLRSLELKLAKAGGALRFYADAEKYEDQSSGDIERYGSSYPVLDDGGDRAREALKP